MAHNCAFCSTETQEILDFGEVALAGGFLKCSQLHSEKKYPLRLNYCPSCHAVQLADVIDAKTLFSDYFYFSGQIDSVKSHFAKYADYVSRWFPHSRVLEIGCNDGFLLGRFADKGATCIGIDPAKNVIESIKDHRLTLVNDFFDEEVAERIVAKHGRQDIVIANNVLAHIQDIQGVTRGIGKVLDDRGTLVMEVHYLGKMIEELQYDWIYHEHLYYYSATTLANHFDRHGLTVFDVEPVKLHAGSMRYYVCKKGFRNPSSAVAKLLESEKGWLDNIETYRKFAERVKAHKVELHTLIANLKKEGATIAGYGASGRANTILQWCGIDGFHLAYVIDDAPAKANHYTPGSHLRIVPRDDERATPQQYFLILAWPYANDICHKVGGKKIIPLPEVRIVDECDNGWRDMDGIGQWRAWK